MGPMGASCRKPRLRFRSTVLVPYALEEGTWGVQPVPETLEDQSWYLPHAYIRNLSLEFDSNLYRWQPLHSTFSSSFQVFLPPLLATMAHFPTLPPWPLPADRKRLCRLKALASWYHACAYALRHTWRCCALEAHRQAGMWAAGLDFFGTPSNTSCFKARWGWWPSQVGIRRSSSPASKYLKVSIMIYIYIYHNGNFKIFASWTRTPANAHLRWSSSSSSFEARCVGGSTKEIQTSSPHTCLPMSFQGAAASCMPKRIRARMISRSQSFQTAQTFPIRWQWPWGQRGKVCHGGEQRWKKHLKGTAEGTVKRLSAIKVGIKLQRKVSDICMWKISALILKSFWNRLNASCAFF